MAGISLGLAQAMRDHAGKLPGERGLCSKSHARLIARGALPVLDLGEEAAGVLLELLLLMSTAPLSSLD